MHAVPIVLALAAASRAAAEEPPYGKLLHDTECLTCHTPAQYTRAKRLVNSLDELRKRVAYCRDDVGAEWDAAETEDVVRYLNTRYYRF
ncbi:MAG: hypothetical protein HY941_11200 [Gammaproteobacteria bacterium]|nr:hypothetical protein [Gammaproteobacteria bacterium]